MCVVPRAPFPVPYLSCSISFSTLVPNLGNVLLFPILWYPLFHHKGKQKISILLYHNDIWSPIFFMIRLCCDVPYIYHLPLLPPACACTTFLSLLSHIFYIFLDGSSFQTNHVVFYTPFGLTCFIRLTHGLLSLQLLHIFYIYCFLGSYQFCFYITVLIACSCSAIIKASVVFLSTLFLAILTNLHLLYPLFAW